MTDDNGLARLHELRLREQAARFNTKLAGRIASARALNDLFHATVATLAPNMFLEVGAFEAAASVRVKAEVPGITVVALEASPVNYEHFSAQQDYAACGVDYRHSAAAAEIGEATFRIDKMEGGQQPHGGNSLLMRADANASQQIEVTVPTTTLDTVAAETKGPVALWIDVEGAARMVLAGAAETLARTDIVKIEVEETEVWPGELVAVDVIAVLLSYGLVPVVRDVEYPGQFNVVFMSEKALRDARVQHLVTQWLYDSAHGWAREPGRLRQSERLRRVARPLRAGTGWLAQRA